jgi:hypothetical protein
VDCLVLLPGKSFSRTHSTELVAEREARVFDQTICRILSLFPKGATNDQLIWRLSASGVRVNPTELLVGLGSLAQRGEVVRDSFGRWQVARPAVIAKPKISERGAGGEAKSPDTLTAVNALCFLATESPGIIETEEADATASLPEWSALLGYYAATQRKDPRGQIEVFADRHGSAWQLFRTTGTWWSGASLRVSIELLPPLLVEAVSKGKNSSAAIGWPVSLFPSPEGVSFIPGLILPVEFRINGSELTLEIESSEPTLNPAWTREVCRHTSWSRTDLPERLFLEGEDNSLGAISDRMRHCLAAIGGQSLRPADLSPEISLTGKGVKNAAALFLPEDGNFTKATAEDLEAIREWPLEKRVNTVLAKLLTAAADAGPAMDQVSVMPPGTRGALTDTQLEAAEAALAGPLTVIQGPPGSGKSQVILSLIISAVTAGKSVLFAARNHQALTEVEQRLREIIPESPILTRARDAEGERDVSFLDALSELAHEHPAELQDTDEVERTKASILQRAAKLQDSRREWKQQTDVHLALSELIDRRDNQAKYVQSKARSTNHWKWLIRVLTLLHLRRGPAADPLQPLPEGASISEINDRISELRARLDEQSSSDSSFSSQREAEQTALGQDISTLAPKLARAVTRPDESARKHFLDRAAELDFTKVRSASHAAGRRPRRPLPPPHLGGEHALCTGPHSPGPRVV